MYPRLQPYVSQAATLCIPGFSDDPMLNARYAEVLEPWARSMLMSQQLAPPIPDGSGGAHSAWASQEPLEQQLAAWRHAQLPLP